ncbi:MAG: AMP-binding protein [Oscillospiraceae bacterium]|nr:AMP-binding protein [Oscillospiraceae bacterium]
MFILDNIKEYAKTSRTALITRDETLTFAQLYAYSQSFAAWLLRRFGESRAPVVIYGGKESLFLPCLFGSLMSGRAYVPVDTVTPISRAKVIAEDIGPDVIVDFSGSWSGADALALDCDALYEILTERATSEAPEKIWVSGEETAYILYTSGSTGKPKGVPVTANNLSCFYGGVVKHLGNTGGGVMLDQVSYSFDVSCCAVYAGLGLGMTLVPVGRDLVNDVGAMFAWLRVLGLTHWVSTPSFAELCVRSKSFSEELLPKLRELLFCGEVLTNNLCRELSARFPSATIINTYGPTEATVLVTAVEVTEQMRLDTRPIPIGYPIDGTELRIDGGEQGELLILGGSVGPGYRNRADLTARRFFFDEKTGMRGFRTGDIAYVENGLYYYSGRIDNQLKLGGYRVEIEDIESNLTRIENISRAAVIPVLEDGRAQYLAAFIQLGKDDGLTALSRAIMIKKKAGEFLPGYMIPRKFIAVDSFPLNQNGKIDKKELEKRLR